MVRLMRWLVGLEGITRVGLWVGVEGGESSCIGKIRFFYVGWVFWYLGVLGCWVSEFGQ